ncbi:hypothetical protein ACQPXS_45240 [Streptomyces sp. CA-142005]|uniref:hypothetical protein n=1 Tax=Streptomyces sp. CA-142005 TaxID=3240052 RepID=UPI003D8A3C12
MALTLWVDGDAAACGRQPNRAARGLIALNRPATLPYIGDVVFTDTSDADGNPHGSAALRL